MSKKFVRGAVLAAVLGSVASLAVAPLVATAQDAKPAQAPAPSAVGDDPVVARVNGAEVKRSEVLTALQQLGPQVQQIPLQAIYPSVLEQVVNAKLVTQAGYKQKLEQSDEVKQRLQAAEQRFVQEAYLRKSIDAKLTDAMVKKQYEDWLKANPPQDEVRARHILVETKEEAQEIIKKLNGGAKFEELAAQQKIDQASAQSQGDLGYFTADMMVEPFAKAAFAMKPGEITKEPVQTDFGWHVIKVEDKRKQTPPTFEEAEPQLRAMVAQDIAGEIVDGLRKDAKIETFNIDGGPMPAPAAPAADAPVGGQTGEKKK